MWLRKDISTICLKEFGVRHQLDLLQENAYIRYNLQKLVSIQIDSEDSKEIQWQHSFLCCNTFWFNIVAYIKNFPHIYSILYQKDIISFTPTNLRKDNFFDTLSQRITFCKQFTEICRTVVFNGRLRNHISKSFKLKSLFLELSERCILSDPAGSRLIPLDNRIHFLRSWLEKLVLRNQANYTILPRETISIFPDTPPSSNSNTPALAPVKAHTFVQIPVPIVSITKPNLLFSRIRKKPSRLSELLSEGDSDSCSSSSSIWAPPFKRTKASVQEHIHRNSK